MIMFDLEQSITEWQREMLAAGVRTPVPLDELESHLREEIQQQMQLGLDADKAFEISIQRIGEPPSLKGEFKKNERSVMQPTAKISIGVIGILLGIGLMIPGSVQLRNEVVMADGKLGLWLLGWFLIVWAFGLFQRIIQSQRPKGEWEKVAVTPVKQTLKTGVGCLVLLMGIALIVPAAAQAGRAGMVELDSLCFAVFGSALVITGAMVTFCSYKRRKA
jgi:hypothetical protein